MNQSDAQCEMLAECFMRNYGPDTTGSIHYGLEIDPWVFIYPYLQYKRNIWDQYLPEENSSGESSWFLFNCFVKYYAKHVFYK